MPDEVQVFEQPDIIIVEGINVLQVSLSRKPQKRRVFVSDFFDFSIYVDASEKDIRSWYLESRFILSQVRFAVTKRFTRIRQQGVG